MSSDTISQGVRWPARLHGRIKLRANAARMDFSAFVVACMQSEQPELSPALAALGEITAIKEYLVAGGAPVDEIARLECLVLDLCLAAAMEARQ